MSRIRNALKALNAKIEAGAEFPDVVDRIAAKHRVSVDNLTKAYDAQVETDPENIYGLASMRQSIEEDRR